MNLEKFKGLPFALSQMELRKMGRKKKLKKEEISEDWCFVCKDGGSLRICDHKDCLKAYHFDCVLEDGSLMKTEGKWICNLHFCFKCNKAPKFYCLCCPSAICGPCLYEAEFAIVKGDKGLCNECLELSLLIEEKKDVDSNGRKLDFSDPRTLEFYFNDYWQIVKGKECLTSEQVISASNLLKRGENYIFASDSDEFDKGGKEISRKRKRSKGKLSAMKSQVKSSRKEFSEWGSKPLLQFLASIGKDTTQELSKQTVAIIISEYCKEKNLFHPERKKKIICDARLQALFGRKSVKKTRLYKLLTSHVVENLDYSVDEFVCTSKVDDDDFVARKKQLHSSSVQQSHSKEVADKISEAQGTEPADKDSTGTNEQEHNVGIPESPPVRTSEYESQFNASVYDDLANVEEYNPWLRWSEKRGRSIRAMSVKKDMWNAKEAVSLQNCVDLANELERNREFSKNTNSLPPVQMPSELPLVVFADAQHAEPACKVYSRRSRQEFSDDLPESAGRTSEGNAIPCHEHYLSDVSAAPPSRPSTAVSQSDLPEESVPPPLPATIVSEPERKTIMIDIIDVTEERADINLLCEGQAFFADLQPLLDEPLTDLPGSSHQPLATPEQINEAKSCFNLCCSMNFEQLMHPAQRDQFLSSLNSLLKCGHFPESMLDLVRNLQSNFLNNTCLYSQCKESVRRADEERKHAESLREGLKDKYSLFRKITGDIKVVEAKILDLRKELSENMDLKADLVEQAVRLVASSKTLREDFFQYIRGSEILEKSKRHGQQSMEEIDTSWKRFQNQISKLL